SINSQTFRKELYYTILLNKNAKILPVFIGDVSIPSELLFHLKYRQGLHIPENFSSDDMFKIVQALRTLQ
ncbi:MAG: hypothetical protein II333_08630, partial [Clostridia bacterium]|nr:hypothetical protein [Clostridia bacterium]